MHDRPCTWFGKGTSINIGGLKLVSWIKTSPLDEMMRQCDQNLLTIMWYQNLFKISLSNDNSRKEHSHHK
jgi:hypothetical protein